IEILGLFEFRDPQKPEASHLLPSFYLWAPIEAEMPQRGTSEEVDWGGRPLNNIQLQFFKFAKLSDGTDITCSAAFNSKAAQPLQLWQKGEATFLPKGRFKEAERVDAAGSKTRAHLIRPW